MQSIREAEVDALGKRTVQQLMETRAALEGAAAETRSTLTAAVHAAVSSEALARTSEATAMQERLLGVIHARVAEVAAESVARAAGVEASLGSTNAKLGALNDACVHTEAAERRLTTALAEVRRVARKGMMGKR